MCEKCDRAFFSELGLEQHTSRNKNKPCGLHAMLLKRQKQKAFYKERRTAIHEEKLLKLGPMKNLAIKKLRGPLTTSEKKMVLQIFEIMMTENGFKRSKAIKETSKLTKRSIKMVRMILKEKLIFGNVIGGPYSRTRKSIYEKLTPEQKDLIRSIVHNEMKKVLEKQDGAQYPTLATLHAAIMKHPDTPKWSKMTSYRILKQLGFM